MRLGTESNENSDCLFEVTLINVSGCQRHQSQFLTFHALAIYAFRFCAAFLPDIDMLG
jgi:hypothetical protein